MPAHEPPAVDAAHAASDLPDATRRRFLLGIGWSGLSLLFTSAVPGLIRFFAPAGAVAGRDLVEAGPLADYRMSSVHTRWIQRDGFWLVNRDGRLFALDARCTHLGCTPRWTPEEGVIRCPCHGSRFSAEGAVFNGPATLPLARFGIRLDRDQVVVDKSLRASMEEAEKDSRFFVSV